MKYLMAVASIFAVTTAGPTQRGLIIPDAIPATVLEFVEPNPGPTFVVNFVPIDFGPIFVPELLEPNLGHTFVDDFGPAPVPQFLEPNLGPTFVDDLVPDIGPIPAPELTKPDFGPTFIHELTPGSGTIPTDSIASISKPTPVKPEIIEIPVNGDVMPVIQILVNINGGGAEINPVKPVLPALPSPIIVDDVPVSSEIVDFFHPIQVIDSSPVSIGTPVLPFPIVSMPDQITKS